MRRLWTAAAVLLSACAAPQLPIGVPNATVEPSATSSARALSDELNCDLPVEILRDSPGDPQGPGGFIHFPGGGFTRDPKADTVADGTRPAAGTELQDARLKTTALPSLFGTADSPAGSITYGAAAGRWLPTGRAQVSADGLRYAYRQYVRPILAGPGPTPLPTGGLIHVVEVQSAADRIVLRWNGAPFYVVVGYAQHDIYLTAYFGGSDGLKLWRLDDTTGSLTKVSDRPGSWLVRNGVAWAATDEGSGQPRQLLRLDLTSGREEIWLSDLAMELTGLDGEGVPLVTVSGPAISGSVLLRVPAPRQPERIFSFARGTDGFQAVVADDHGTWLGGARTGIYLFTKAAGVRKVSDSPGLPVGPCR